MISITFISNLDDPRDKIKSLGLTIVSVDRQRNSNGSLVWTIVVEEDLSAIQRTALENTALLMVDKVAIYNEGRTFKLPVDIINGK